MGARPEKAECRLNAESDSEVKIKFEDIFDNSVNEKVMFKKCILHKANFDRDIHSKIRRRILWALVSSLTRKLSLCRR